MAKKKPTRRMKGLSREFFSLNDLFVAYRKAKQDVFQEKTQANRVAFAKYEQRLNAHLDSLYSRLTSASVDWFSDLDFIGGVGFIPRHIRVTAAINTTLRRSSFQSVRP